MTSLAKPKTRALFKSFSLISGEVWPKAPEPKWTIMAETAANATKAERRDPRGIAVLIAGGEAGRIEDAKNDNSP